MHREGFCRPAAAAGALIIAAAVLALPAAAADIEVVAALPEAPGNITVTPSGRIIVSMQQGFQPAIRAAELTADGTLVPFPNDDWNAGGEAATSFDAPLGVRTGADGVVWILDNGQRSQVPAKVVGWDLAGDKPAHIIPLPEPVTIQGSFLNDLAVDDTHGALYITDTHFLGPQPALIVVDIASGAARRLLDGHAGLQAEDIDMMIDGRPAQLPLPDGSGAINPRIGANGIALDVDDGWLYLGATSARALYRVRTSDLLDEGLSADDLAARVERYSDKPLSDGLAIDQDGNVYVTEIEANAVGVIHADDQRYERLAQDDALLSWPDGMGFGPDGMLYVVANQLGNSPLLNGGVNAAAPPFHIVKLRPLAPGRAGQ